MWRLSILLLAVAAAGGCTMDEETTTPTEAGCLRIDGAYAFQYEEGTCGRSGGSEAPVAIVSQTGCRFNAVLPGYALVDGTVNGSTLLFAVTYLVSGTTGCGNSSLSGSGSVSFEGGRLTLRGTYGASGGVPAGGSGSCACLPAAGGASFLLR